MVVPVMLGSRACKFAIDTAAAGHGRVLPSIASELGYETVGEVRAGDGSGRIGGSRAIYRAPSLRIGEMTFADLDMIEKAEIGGSADGIDGILGIGLFEGLRVTLDYAEPSLKLDHAKLDPAGSVALQRRGPLLVTELMVGDAAMPAHIDTGNVVGAVVVPTAFADGLPKAGEPRVAGVARTNASEMQITVVPVGAPITLGAFPVAGNEVTFPSLRPDIANVGARAFAGKRLVLDLAESRMRLEAA